MNKAGKVQRRTPVKNNKRGLKTKVLKKFNFLNAGIAVFCVLAGYLIVFFPFRQDQGAGKSGLDEVSKSVNRIADSFELYNSKRFVPPGQ